MNETPDNLKGKLTISRLQSILATALNSGATYDSEVAIIALHKGEVSRVAVFLTMPQQHILYIGME